MENRFWHLGFRHLWSSSIVSSTILLFCGTLVDANEWRLSGASALNIQWHEGHSRETFISTISFVPGIQSFRTPKVLFSPHWNQSSSFPCWNSQFARVYSVSRLVCPHDVHLKKIKEDCAFSDPTPAVQVSLPILPHSGQMTSAIGEVLSPEDFSSITAIPPYIWLIILRLLKTLSASSFSLYPHFGHCNKGLFLWITIRILPHLGQKLIQGTRQTKWFHKFIC